MENTSAELIYLEAK